jgi:ferrochelatase
MINKKIGILISNLGTPDAPTTSAVRRYLKEFLSDTRVIELPKILWKPILYGVILPFRPKKNAELYQKIWTSNGSPLLTYTKEITNLLEKNLQKKFALDIVVETGMRYGNPSIPDALQKLRERGASRILVFPLYPQYAAATTASTFDAVMKELKTWRHQPEVRTLNHYADDKSYIQAVSQTIRNYQIAKGKGFLLFSFHGIPQKNVDDGDPYMKQCEVTASLIAKELEIDASQWSVAFQSRLGSTKWLTPYTDKVLKVLPAQGIRHVQVVCPGFAVDCLETLEEIAIRGKEQFLDAGGKAFEYIPALNCNPLHINTLTDLVTQHINGWI